MDQDMDHPDMAQGVLDGDGMGHDINMEDLFGEAPVSMPVDKRLPRLLAELSDSGCCRRVAWSRYGPVAAIAPDSKTIKSYCLARNRKTGKWDLSKPHDIRPPDYPDTRLKHLEWSWLGTELAVVDSAGRVFIYSCLLGHAHMDLRRDASVDPTDEMGAVVGMAWLPPHQALKLPTYWSATRDGDRWNWKRDEQRSTGPMNPLERETALFCFTRGGRLRLLYQAGEWREKSFAVDDGLFDLELYITHASFAADRDDGMFLATYDTNASLRMYKIKVDWGFNKDSKEQPKQINPVLKVTPFSMQAHCFPDGPDNGEAEDVTGFGGSDGARYTLSHLQMIPPPMDQPVSENRFPTIITVFRNMATVASAVAGPAQQSPFAPPTLLWTWKLVAQPSALGCLASGFDQVSAKKRPTEGARSRAVLAIEKHSSTPIHNNVLSITPIRHNTILAVAFADATVDWLDHETKQPIQADYNFAEITSLPQSGFTFEGTEPVVTLELSPNACLAAYQDAAGALKLRQVENIVSSLDAPSDDERRTAIATALALQYDSSLLQYRAFLDDILSLMPPSTDVALTYEFLEQTHSALGYSLDLSSDDPSKATNMHFRTPWIQKLLGAQACLGPAQDGQPWLPAKLALVTLNLRLVTFVIMMFFRHDLSLKADMALSLCGMVQWSLDFMVYMLQEIDRLSEHLLALPSHPNFTSADISAFLRAENSPALLLLFSSVSRVLLRMICRPLRHGWIHCINGTKTAPSPAHKDAFTKAVQIYASSPVCAHAGGAPSVVFEPFSGQLDLLVKDAYEAAAVSDAQKARMETNMFVRAEVPDALVPAIRKLLADLWPRFLARPDVDLGRIIRHDVTWLGFVEDRYSRAWHARHLVDVLRKVVLSGAAPRPHAVRRCPRCASAMDDILPGPQWPAWVLMNMKNCVCLGNWGASERYGGCEGEGGDDDGSGEV